MVWYVNYKISRGLPWERLVLLKDRRSRRVVTPTSPRAFIKTGTTSLQEVTATVTAENAIKLSLTAAQTTDLPVGELSYDVFAVCDYAGTTAEKQVSKGLVTVAAVDRVTPEEDSKALELRYYQNTDFRRTFTWKDSDGVVQTVSDAFMQAKNTSGTVVVDLRWYATIPAEATIIALSPANKRGYLAPSATSGATLDMHISDANDVVAGTYTFDLFVKDSAGDWDVLAAGSLVVEASVSAPPS